MKKLKSKEKKEFVEFIKKQFGETIVYSHDGYPLYFDDKGNMRSYDLEEGYNIFKSEKDDK